jgi:hypothetical protein
MSSRRNLLKKNARVLSATKLPLRIRDFASANDAAGLPAAPVEVCGVILLRPGAGQEWSASVLLPARHERSQCLRAGDRHGAERGLAEFRSCAGISPAPSCGVLPALCPRDREGSAQFNG